MSMVTHSWPPTSEELAAIAEEISDLYTILYDAKPVMARAAVNQDLLVCTLTGGLSPGDRVLLERGYEANLRAFRDEFFRAVRDKFSATVAELTGFPVTSQNVAFDAGSETTMMTFGLMPISRESDDERVALRNWSRQVRLNARRLREVHKKARRDQTALATRMREERLAREAEKLR